jgi:RNA polymerase sigma factor (TIGR02999 family)
MPLNPPPGGAGEAGGRPLDRVADELYHELHRIAAAAMVGQSPAHTLQPTAIVHEAWLRLARARELDVSDRRRFLALAARVMRQVLVDHARGKQRQRRGGGAIGVELREEAIGGAAPPIVDLLALDQALSRLAALDPRQVEIFELRYLAGFDVEEVAQVLCVSPTTVKRETAMARAWLLAALAATPDTDPDADG